MTSAEEELKSAEEALKEADERHQNFLLGIPDDEPTRQLLSDVADFFQVLADYLKAKIEE